VFRSFSRISRVICSSRPTFIGELFASVLFPAFRLAKVVVLVVYPALRAQKSFDVTTLEARIERREHFSSSVAWR
jgi:hypothetical protein